MCLAVPSKVISVQQDGIALVDIMGVQRQCSLMLTPDAQPGDYVLVHAGYAIQRIEEQDAAETLRLLGEIPDLLGDEFAGEIAQASGTHETGAPDAAGQPTASAAMPVSAVLAQIAATTPKADPAAKAPVTGSVAPEPALA